MTSTATTSPLLNTGAIVEEDEDVILRNIVLHGFTAQDSFNSIRQIVRNNPQLAGEIFNDKTLVMLAIENSKQDIALYLTKEYGNLVKPSFRGVNNTVTAVHFAAAKGFADVIQALAQIGASITETTTFEFIPEYRGKSLTPLHIAAFFGQEKAANMLMLLGADLNASINSIRYTTPQALAARFRHQTLSDMLGFYAANPVKLMSAKFKHQLDEKNQQIESLSQQVEMHKQQTIAHKHQVNIHKQQIEELNHQIVELNQQFEEYKQQVEELDQQVDVQNQQIEELNQQVNAQNQQVGTLKQMLEQSKAQYKIKEAMIDELLLDFVRQGKTNSTIEIIRREVANINCSNSERQTPLAIICCNPSEKHAPICSALCQQPNLDLGAVDINGDNAFHHIMTHFQTTNKAKSSKSMFKSVIAKAGDDISLFCKANNNGEAPIHTAFEKNLKSIVSIVIKTNKNVEWPLCNSDGDNILHLMISNYKECTTKRIFELVKDAMSSASEVFQELMNTSNRQHLSPLLVAIKKNNKFFVEELLKAGCDLTKRYANNWNCLHFLMNCTMDPTRTEIFKAILKSVQENKAAVEILNMQDDEGNTPVHSAIHHNQIMALTEFLSLKELVDLTITNKAGLAPHHMTVELQNRNAMELVVDGGAPINDEDKHGRTPLQIAATKVDEVACDFLIDNGAEPAVDNKIALSNEATEEQRNLQYKLGLCTTVHFKVKSKIAQHRIEYPAEFAQVRAVKKLGKCTTLVKPNASSHTAVLKILPEKKAKKVEALSKVDSEHIVKILLKDSSSRLVVMERLNQGTLKDSQWSYLEKQIVLKLSHYKRIGLGLLLAVVAMRSAGLEPELTPQNVYLNCDYGLTKVTAKLGLFGKERKHIDILFRAPEENQEDTLESDDEESTTATTTTTTAPSNCTVDQTVKPYHIARWAVLMNTIVTKEQPKKQAKNVGTATIFNELDDFGDILKQCCHQDTNSRPTVEQLVQYLQPECPVQNQLSNP